MLLSANLYSEKITASQELTFRLSNYRNYFFLISYDINSDKFISDIDIHIEIDGAQLRLSFSDDSISFYKIHFSNNIIEIEREEDSILENIDLTKSQLRELVSQKGIKIETDNNIYQITFFYGYLKFSNDNNFQDNKIYTKWLKNLNTNLYNENLTSSQKFVLRLSNYYNYFFLKSYDINSDESILNIYIDIYIDNAELSLDFYDEDISFYEVYFSDTIVEIEREKGYLSKKIDLTKSQLKELVSPEGIKIRTNTKTYQITFFMVMPKFIVNMRIMKYIGNG